MRSNAVVPTLAITIAVAIAAASISDAESQVRRADAHQHSVATGQLAVEDSRLELMLQIPGANLVGFEHPPRDNDQAARLEAARQRLATGDWLALPPRAGCESIVAVEMPGFAGADGAAPGGSGDGEKPGHHGVRDGGHDDHDEEHHDDHHGEHHHGDGEHQAHHHHDDDHGDHDHDGGHQHEDGHAEFRVTAEAECDASPAWVELRLFDGWPDNRSIRLDAITETRQLRGELTAGSPRLDLE